MRTLPGLLLTIVMLVPSTSRIGTVAAATGGAVFGALAGTGVAAGVLIARARLQNHYIDSVDEVVGWPGLPIPAGAVAGGAAGAAGPGVLAGAVIGSVAGAAVLIPAGVLIGLASSDDAADRWAGGTISGALGLILGFVAGWMFVLRRGRSLTRSADHDRRRGRSARAAPLGLLLLGGFAGCGGGPYDVVPGRAIPPDPGAVESVVLLVGDPGEAIYSEYPVLPAMTAEVDAWAESIGRDSAVAVVVLGDIVYPYGMHEPGTAEHATDSARVASQVRVVSGPAARQHGAGMYFVAGNHDWGLREDWQGTVRLLRLDEFLDRERSRGANVDLLPPAGTGVPEIVDVGDRLRLVLLDTAWWLLDMERHRMDEVFEAVGEALATAGRRHVVLASHHPFSSVGPHGGTFSIWRTLGLRRLLYKSGTLLQDIHSRPYRELRLGMGDVFRIHGRPLAWAGGHDHSLQILMHDSIGAPRYSIVSGSASKLSDVGTRPGLMFGQSAPGYVRLIVRDNGAVDAEVVAAPPRFLSCSAAASGAQAQEECMREGVQSFAPIYSTRLAQPDGT